jgi:murein DD-endopeptidase MepM/ murein hydrolase activator NlpD
MKKNLLNKIKKCYNVNMNTKMLKKTVITFFITSALVVSWVGVNMANGQTDDAFNDEIKQLNSKIQAQKQQLDALANKQKAYANSIAVKQAEKNTLASQLSLLEDRVGQAELEIDATNLDINKTNLELQKINLDILDTNVKIDEQKDRIAHLLRLVYKQDRASSIEILLLNDSISEFLNHAKYLENANDELRQNLSKLQYDKERLDKTQADAQEKQRQLATLKIELESRKSKLDYEKSQQVYLLEETKESEKAYQTLLQQAQKEAAQAEAEISGLERTIREKMTQKDRDRLSGSDSTLSWPISGRVITSPFRDPNYPFRRIIGEHSGTDFRSPQGSPLYAAADGYVARVKFDGSTAYAYIMIIHNDGISTVYGHVSAVNVEVDQYVVKGQLIGKTGGAPGRPGSGPFSTGAHLHFEVRKNGIPVNAMDYLP